MRQSYSALLLLTALFAAGCERTSPDEAVFSSETIRFTASVPETRALLESGSLTEDGTKFKVYDYLSDYNGTISGHSGEEFAYFDDNITYDGSATPWKWVFDADASYRWTHTGVHKFVGWLMLDPSNPTRLNTNTFFNPYTPAFSGSTHNVSLTKSLQANSDQYDFLYSDIVPVDVDNGIPESVPLPMQHLFSALGLSVSNFSESPVTVYSVTLPEFPAKNSVKLEYGDLSGNVAVTSPSGGAYPDPVYDSNNPFLAATTLPSAGVSLPAKSGNTVSYDVFSGSQVTQASPQSFKLVWPATYACVCPETPYTGPKTGDNATRDYMAADSLIVVDYAQNGVRVQHPIRIKFPNDPDDRSQFFLSPGTKTHLDLQFLDKQILLKFSVLPWQYEAFPMSFEGDAISSTQLKFTEGTYSDGGKVTDASGKHQVIELIQGSSAGNYVATGTFYIYTPVNATLTVGLGGNADDFTVQLNGGNESTTINPERNGGRVDFKIMPNGTPQRGARVSLHFSVRNNGRESDADTEINRDHYYVDIP